MGEAQTRGRSRQRGLGKIGDASALAERSREASRPLLDPGERFGLYLAGNVASRAFQVRARKAELFQFIVQIFPLFLDKVVNRAA